ncbi:hypothetical protein BDV29DRAFT_155396 [Aspergillus leporis]|uniref:Methyltransferase type 11 domain-containing protein n=1 Tax=Aspergillus leporis TaxID=41062 RepID=A0A5N5X4Q7_9EURO|nr:hypothetical protein BDV29DRAFT_155396 [Aspergillus leporis]
MKTYPLTNAQGNDITPIQPNWILPKCLFEVDDFEANWVYSRPSDYIHGRELAFSVTNFDRLFRQAFTHLKPRGYIEMQFFRIDVFADDDSLARHIRDKLVKAGFEDVECKIHKVPINLGPQDPKRKEIGTYFYAQQLQGIHSYVPEILREVLG